MGAVTNDHDDSPDSDHEAEGRVPAPDPEALAAAFAGVEAELARRWPETRIAPDLGRETALMELLGDPQRSAPVIHIAGTNGKSSTARITESLLRAFGLTTGTYLSPHLHTVRERILLDGEPVERERFVAAYQDIAPYVGLIDARDPHAPMTAFEVLTAIAFACFADAPVDVMIIECGMGGRWDATNVVSPTVDVITPIGLDHMEYLGPDVAAIASEKAGIITSDAPVVLGRQDREVADVIAATAEQQGAALLRLGRDFSVEGRVVAVGGQLLTIAGLAGEYRDIYLPLHGIHQAENAAVALAAAERFFGDGTRMLNEETVQAGFAAAASPGRLEVLRTSPTIVADAAHNPAGATALAAALPEAFGFDYLVAVVAVFADKDASGILAGLGDAVDEVVVTVNSSPRAMDIDDLAAAAVSQFGIDRVHVADDMADALEVAVEAADRMLADDVMAGVLVTGSVTSVGDARALLRGEDVR